MTEKAYYLFETESEFLAKFIVRGYSTKPDAKIVLFSCAKKKYIDTANLTEFTLEEARSHWSYLVSRGWYGTDTPQMDYAVRQRKTHTNYALEA